MSADDVCKLIDECYQGRATIKWQAERITELEKQLEQSGIHGNYMATQLMCCRADVEAGKQRIAELEAELERTRLMMHGTGGAK